MFNEKINIVNVTRTAGKNTIERVKNFRKSKKKSPFFLFRFCPTGDVHNTVTVVSYKNHKYCAYRERIQIPVIIEITKPTDDTLLYS